MYISIFSDELATDITKGLPIIKSWGLDAVDLRGRVFGKGIHALDDAELHRNAISSFSFPYLGSSKFFCLTGEEFAKTLTNKQDL